MIYLDHSVIFRNSVGVPPTRSSDYEMDILRGHQQDRHLGPKNERSHSVGVVLFLAVVLLWTASGFVTQFLYRAGYDKPFLVTYTSTSLFVLYLVPRLVSSWPQRKRSTEDYQPLPASESQEVQDVEHVISTPVSSISPSGEKEGREGTLTVKDTARVAFYYCWLWFIANWAINAALNYTTVASSTIITSTSGFFTLVLGHIFGVERFTKLKTLAVLVCFLGVVLVSLSDSQRPTLSPTPMPTPSDLGSTLQSLPNQPTRHFLGDCLALVSAMFYAFYVVFMKVKVGDESKIDMQLFLGLVGFFNLVTCWPVGLIIHWVGMEKLELPWTRNQYIALLANMAIFLLSDYLYVLAMLKTTPLLVTIGISLSIPVAVLGDFVLNSPVQLQVMMGAGLVLLSFAAIARTP